MAAGVFLGFLVYGLIAVSCNSNDDHTEKEPSVVQPPSEAITDLTKIVNDSVIVPDTTIRDDVRRTKSDSIKNEG